MYVLYGCKGAGSAVVEVTLHLLGQPYRFEEVTPWEPGPRVEALRAINPLVQIPTLVLPDGMVMTESAAILLALLDRHPGSDLIPPSGSPERASFYRWITFIAANIYAMYTIGDFPARWVEGEATQAHLKAKSVERTKACWGVLEAQLAPSPYLLGPKMTALDLYVAMISRWRPGRAWFRDACPKLVAAIDLTESHPEVKPVWERNFP